MRAYLYGSCTGTAALALFSWTKWQHHANFFGFQVLVDQKFDNVIDIFCNKDFTVGQCSRISLEKQSTNGFQSVSDGIFVARVDDDVVNSVDQNLAGRARQVVSGWLKRWMQGINNRHYSIRKSKKKAAKALIYLQYPLLIQQSRRLKERSIKSTSSLIK